MSKNKPTLDDLRSVFPLNHRAFIEKRITQCTGKTRSTLTDADLVEGYTAARKAYDMPTYLQQAGPLLRVAIESHYASKKQAFTRVPTPAPTPKE